MRRNILSVLIILGISLNACAAESNTPKVVIVVDWVTGWGYIGLELFQEEAPITVDNFLQYVDSGFYNNIVFHRAVDNPDIIQTGSHEEIAEEPYVVLKTDGLRDPIINESDNGLLNERGTIAMALKPDDPNSATSSYYFNVVHNSYLDGEYCVFGRVISGMSGVDWIAGLYTSTDYGFSDLPPDVPLYYSGGHFYLIYVYTYRAPPGLWLRSDLNNSGIVNLRDFAILANNWMAQGDDLTGDINEEGPDGIVDYNDLAVFSSQWLVTTSWY